MERVIEKIIDRIDSYEIFNNLIPGMVFVTLMEKTTSFRVISDSTWVNLVTFYFGGMLISRVGSIIVEKFLKGIKLLKHANHTDYVKAEREDARVQELSMINNMYRTYTALALGLVVVILTDCLWGYIKNYSWSRLAAILTFSISMLLLCAASYVKHSRYVVSRISTVVKEQRKKK